MLTRSGPHSFSVPIVEMGGFWSDTVEAADLGLSVGHVATGTGSDATPVVSGDTPDHPRWKIYLVALMAGVVAMRRFFACRRVQS